MQEAHEDAAHLREEATKCRRLADAVNDQPTIDALRNLAEQYEKRAAQADAIAKQQPRHMDGKPHPKMER